MTAGGKNVAPAVLEDRLRAHPLISQCLVVGDRRPFIAALVTIDEETWPSWLAGNGAGPGATVADLRADPALRAEIQSAIDEANQAVSQAEAIREFRILPRDWTEASGELTPSLKVKPQRGARRSTPTRSPRSMRTEPAVARRTGHRPPGRPRLARPTGRPGPDPDGLVVATAVPDDPRDQGGPAGPRGLAGHRGDRPAAGPGLGGAAGPDRGSGDRPPPPPGARPADPLHRGAGHLPGRRHHGGRRRRWAGRAARRHGGRRVPAVPAGPGAHGDPLRRRYANRWPCSGSPSCCSPCSARPTAGSTTTPT